MNVERPTPAQTWARALAAIAPLRPDRQLTLGAVLDGVAATQGDKPALSAPGDTLTYAALAARKNQYAHWALAQGIAPGSVVALLMHNRPDYPAIWLGLSQIGVVVALLNTAQTGAALAQAIAAAGARHIIAEPAFAAALDAAAVPPAVTIWIWNGETGRVLAPEAFPAHPVAPENGGPFPAHIALLIYTSGTTGLPKAARISHARVLEWSFWFAALLDATPDDRLFNCLPLYHSTGGVVGIGAMLVRGGAVELRRRFSASTFWQDVAHSRSTIFLYIGELCRYLLAVEAQAPAHVLRLCVGNGLREDVWRDFQARFAIPRILEFYASTEGNVSLYNIEGRPGAIGRVPRFLAHRFPVALIRGDVETGAPLRDAQGHCIRCTPGEAGEAIGKITAAHGPDAFDGYTDAAATDAKILRDVFAPGDAWFRTGDLMRQDGDGFFYFVDRMGDTFRWKGENVSTTQVEAALLSCRGVTGAVVYGVHVPGAEGRAGMAAITVSAEFNPHKLHEDVSALLPAYARPMFVRVCERLETTGTFKPVKASLQREGFTAGRVLVSEGGTYRVLR